MPTPVRFLEQQGKTCIQAVQAMEVRATTTWTATRDLDKAAHIHQWIPGTTLPGQGQAIAPMQFPSHLLMVAMESRWLRLTGQAFDHRDRLSPPKRNRRSGGTRTRASEGQSLKHHRLSQRDAANLPRRPLLLRHLGGWGRIEWTVSGSSAKEKRPLRARRGSLDSSEAERGSNHGAVVEKGIDGVRPLEKKRYLCLLVHVCLDRPRPWGLDIDRQAG